MKHSSKKVCQDIIFVIQQLENEEYTIPLKILHENSIGRHLRHTLEIFESVVEANDTFCLNYDLRERNPIIENSLSDSILALKNLSLKIENLNFDQKIRLTQNLNLSSVEIESCISREILYCLEHCTHHLMFIRIAIEQNFPHIIIPDDFGIALSTLKYREKSEA